MASTNKTTNYSLSQFLADDVPSWISDYTADMQKIEEGMTDNKAGVKSVQPDEYSDASTYSVGDYCIENNTIYKCKTAINSPEEFNPSHWEETTIYKELSALNSSIENKVSLADINNNNLDDFRSGMHFSYAQIAQGHGMGALWEYQYEIGGMYYGAQLYLSYADGLRYRSRDQNTWGSWKSIVSP